MEYIGVNLNPVSFGFPLLLLLNLQWSVTPADVITLSGEDIDRIVTAHNEHRGSAELNASNMQPLVSLLALANYNSMDNCSM